MNLKRVNLRKLFYNNKFVLVFSIIISFFLWIKFSTSSSEVSSKTISNIPITVALSEESHQDGLVVFGIDDVTAEVSVSGNRIVLGQLSKDNIQIFAQQSAGLINTTGNYTLELGAKKSGLLTDYDIISSVSPRFINVFVDRYKSKTLDIVPEISYKADSNSFSSPVSLSETSVTVSGPESIVSNITKACVESEIKDTITKTTTFSDLPISLYDSENKKVSLSMLSLSISKVDATIAILDKKLVRVSPTFTNKPSGLDLYSNQISVAPSRIEIAGSSDILNSLDKIELEPLDFSKVDNSHKEFDLALKIPSGCKNLSNTYSARLKLNMGTIFSKNVNVNKFDFINLPSGKSASPTTLNLNVKVEGPLSELKNTNNQNVSAQIDLSGKEDFSGTAELPAKIVIDSSGKCWAFGNHSVNVKIT